ncbi:LysR family transcriptional regulator [Orrella sp. JC864]|uniref:LysR family transcriptional regulator n=1 Tax=Orrella sp. JC864 TaxID=3120298 RepID=UPI0012BC8EBE
MELRTLRAYVEVVRQGGFSQAAKAVHATQPTISKAVRALEDELGVILLERLPGQPIRMTAAGEAVYRRAQALLAERDDLLKELDELRGFKRGELRLGLPPLGSSVLFAPLFAQYRARFPGIDIRLVEHGSKRLEEMLQAGDIELAASLLPVPPQFEWQAVSREPLVVALPHDHALAAASHATMKALADSPFILFDSGFALNPIILAACQRSGFAPTVAARSGQIDFIIALVAARLGVAFLPRMIAEQHPHPGVRYVPLEEPDTVWHMVLVWRQGGYLSHAALAWLALAQENYAPL